MHLQEPPKAGPIQKRAEVEFCSFSSLLPSVVLQLSEAAVVPSAIVARKQVFPFELAPPPPKVLDPDGCFSSEKPYHVIVKQRLVANCLESCLDCATECAQLSMNSRERDSCIAREMVLSMILANRLANDMLLLRETQCRSKYGCGMLFERREILQKKGVRLVKSV